MVYLISNLTCINVIISIIPEDEENIHKED